ncbi:unnamed protein product [Orchesella dallaii]|uniref:F-box only protein 6 n=1 Tax=Orchesella dallaii TaxID=48710 RepID=A0ABP1RX25_9HEXA
MGTQVLQRPADTKELIKDITVNGCPNGFLISGQAIPETVVELILSKVPVEDLLKCNLVCKAWRNLISRKSLWKICFDDNKANWNTVPEHVRDKPNGWMVLYAQLRNEILSKNYIKNPSGHRQFEGWTIFSNGGDQWRVEEEPHGSDPLPNLDIPFFGIDEDKSCFTSSFGWCSKYYIVNLWREGLTPELMKLMLPFKIKCSQMYTARFDCGGVFDWELRLLDSEEKRLCQHKAPRIEVPAIMEWQTAEFAFEFGSDDEELLKDLQYLVFIHEGKDTQFWAGHYGMKFARSCVTFECLYSQPENSSSVEPPETFGKDGGVSTIVRSGRYW